MSAVDIPQIIHMCVSGITTLAALYFKVAHGKLLERVSVLEGRSLNEKKRLDKLDSHRRKK
jgi:hypothetical protein